MPFYEGAIAGCLTYSLCYGKKEKGKVREKLYFLSIESLHSAGRILQKQGFSVIESEGQW